VIFKDKPKLSIQETKRCNFW